MLPTVEAIEGAELVVSALQAVFSLSFLPTVADALVSGLLMDLGRDSTQQYDLGGIVSARGPERYFVLFAAILQIFHFLPFNIRVVR